MIVPVVLGSLVACARIPPGSTDTEGAEPTVLEFRNESLAQADVYVVSAGTGARRIGTVMAGRTENLTVPREIAIRGSVTIVARLLARSRTASSGSLVLTPGTRLSVRLPLDERTLVVLPGTS